MHTPMDILEYINIARIAELSEPMKGLQRSNTDVEQLARLHASVQNVDLKIGHAKCATDSIIALLDMQMLVHEARLIKVPPLPVPGLQEELQSMLNSPNAAAQYNRRVFLNIKKLLASNLLSRSDEPCFPDVEYTEAVEAGKLFIASVHTMIAAFKLLDPATKLKLHKYKIILSDAIITRCIVRLSGKGNETDLDETTDPNELLMKKSASAAIHWQCCNTKANIRIQNIVDAYTYGDYRVPKFKDILCLPICVSCSQSRRIDGLEQFSSLLPCGHVCHTTCSKSHKSTCPQCKSSVTQVQSCTAINMALSDVFWRLNGTQRITSAWGAHHKHSKMVLSKSGSRHHK